jgi:hypothetical protein
MFQRTSLHWLLSALSPVWIARSSCSCVIGLTVLRTCFTISSATWGMSPSCGR